MNTDLQRVMDEHPELGAAGYGLPKPGEREWLAREEDEFELARQWIRENLVMSNRPCTESTSYGIKHVMEADFRVNNPEVNGYSMNGTFIAAAIAEGYKFTLVSYPIHHGGNVYLHVTVGSLHRAERKADMRY